jgi:hypothetical protein
MKRWVRRLLGGGLLLCGIAVAAEWVRSYWREDRLVVAREGRCVQVVSRAGRVLVLRVEPYPDARPWTWESEELGPPVTPGNQAGVGGAVTFFLHPREQRRYGPVTVSRGRASWDPDWAKNRTRFREAARAAARVRAATGPSPALPPLKVSDAEARRVVQGLNAMDVPDALGLTAAPSGSTAGARSEPDLRVPDFGPADALSLDARPRAAPPPAVNRPGTFQGGLAGAGLGAGAGGGGPWRVAGQFRLWPQSPYDAVDVPYGVLLALPLTPLLLVAAARLARWRVRRRRARRGLCLACGYDLRQNETGRCPECGVAVG